MGEKHEDDRAPDLGGSSTRRTRTETVDHAAMLKAVKEAFEAGGASSRGIIDAQAKALSDAYAEIGRLQTACSTSIGKSQELVGTLQKVASQNVALTLAEGQNKTREQEIIQKGENTRHAWSLLATNPFLGLLIEKVLPGVNILPPKPAGEGNTPREAAERFAASLRSGSDGAKMLLDVLGTYCEEEMGRPGDLPLLLAFFAESVKPPEPETPAEVVT